MSTLSLGWRNPLNAMDADFRSGKLPDLFSGQHGNVVPLGKGYSGDGKSIGSEVFQKSGVEIANKQFRIISAFAGF